MGIKNLAPLLNQTRFWSPTTIDQATFCIFKWFLLNEYKPRIKIPMKSKLAFGIFLHHFIEKRFYKIDKDGGRRPRYKSAEKCANAASGWWIKNYVLSGTCQNEPIIWKYKKEGWALKEDIHNMFLKSYDYFASRIPVFVEYKFKFSLDNRFFVGKIDQILEGPVIIDIKTGERRPGEKKLKYDPQFTLYCLAISCYAHHNRWFAEKIGVSKQEAEQWAGNPIYLSDKIKMEYYMMRYGETFHMTRDDIKYVDFCRMIDGFEKQLETGIIHPYRGRLCDYCEINEDCDRITTLYKGKVPINPQLNLFASAEREQIPKKDARRLTLFTKKVMKTIK